MRTLFVSMLLVPAAAFAQSPEAAVTAVVNGFHAAIKSGNAAAATQLFADDAYFLESGGIETRAEYIANHLPADIEFEKEVKSEWKSYKVTVQGDTAWATSTEDISGTFEGRPANLDVVELMVLSRQGGAWKIRSISWSSRRK